MSQIVNYSNPAVFAAITDKTGYVAARKEAQALAKKHNLQVADLPLVISAMASNQDLRSAIRPSWIDTISGEYHGKRKDFRSYEVWHSVGTLATADGLEKSFPNMGDYAFMPISAKEWTAVSKGSFDGKTVARLHLSDIKKGNVPSAGTPYSVFVNLDKDKSTINPAGQLNYETFMKDDRVLMITGSMPNREALAKMLFGKESEGGENRSSIGSYHRINEVAFDEEARGRLVYLDGGGGGLGGDYGIYYGGRFVGVSAGGAQTQKVTASPKVRAPTLEQTLAVINNADLNREGMVGALRQLYQP